MHEKDKQKLATIERWLVDNVRIEDILPKLVAGGKNGITSSDAQLIRGKVCQKQFLKMRQFSKISANRS